MSTVSDSQTSTSIGQTMPEIRVYNTLSKTKEPFVPLKAPQVGIYLCGPTVYAESHIGHMVGPVIFDTIKRYLTHNGYEVTLVVNITDVDDKLIAKSRERGVPMSQIAIEMTADYMANLKELGVNQIDYMPRATDHMSDIIQFIQSLESQGYAYAVEGDVFFETSRDPSYGELSNRSTDQQQGEGGGAAARKRSPSDFALWKSAKAGEPAWDSPWGKGRPGWHIECSAMSHRLLGETFDIHGGGLDLMFPHHENERAQSNCCHNAPMVKYWMHNGLMRAGSKGKVGGKSDREANANTETLAEQTEGKISRSKGGGGLADLIRNQTGERLRFFLLRTHYRSTIVFNDEGLEEAGTSLETFYRFFDRLEELTGTSFYDLKAPRRRDEGKIEAGDNAVLIEIVKLRDKYFAAMDDDFNTGSAISVLFDMLRTMNRHIDQSGITKDSPADSSDVQVLLTAAGVLRELVSVLGLFEKPPVQAAGGDDADSALAGELMTLLIDLRKSARENKDFATSDAIRDRLTALGIALLDKKDGTSWERSK
ncbi:Cysteine--tRNA ligase [Roseimaritima multifibrata]|uniref:Cysteine--tRNA ligase n=1 Tax=Roseimaritima multifibrata TaxID=1930274 RepID=A0A517MN41_9BACT|nr:cysteine--tRNA ligase [Roseimaritima multifibrata]QDS96303.1 Cysteine--tRNA ligase [Roseimaritima multifibrata]